MFVENDNNYVSVVFRKSMFVENDNNYVSVVIFMSNDPDMRFCLSVKMF